MKEDFISTAQLAHLLGVSRITIFNRIKQGKITALKVGRNFVIRKKDVSELTIAPLKRQEKEEITRAVKKTVREYGEVLRLLGKE